MEYTVGREAVDDSTRAAVAGKAAASACGEGRRRIVRAAGAGRCAREQHGIQVMKPEDAAGCGGGDSQRGDEWGGVGPRAEVSGKPPPCSPPLLARNPGRRNSGQWFPGGGTRGRGRWIAGGGARGQQGDLGRRSARRGAAGGVRGAAGAGSGGGRTERRLVECREDRRAAERRCESSGAHVDPC
ncbi:hypothetical protein SEVIR_1G313616v4 [Setaria viridis]